MSTTDTKRFYAARQSRTPPVPIRTVVVLVALSLAGCLAVPGSGTGITDDTGANVQFDELDRIVPTSVDVVEILLELGHRERIAAVPDWIDSEVSCVTPPPGAEGIPQIGRPHVMNAEEIIPLRPSLVIEKDHPLQPSSLAAQLRQAGIPVFVIKNDETLDNVRHTYRRVAEILATVDAEAPTNADARIGIFDGAIANVTSAVADAKHEPRALYQFPSGLVAGRGTSGHLMLELAGATNIVDALQLDGYKQLSGEALARADPERVLASCTAAGDVDAFFGTPKYAATTAARLKPETLRIDDPSITGLVGPRFAAGLQGVAEWLHPEAFGLIEPNVNWTLQGRDLTVDTTASTADSPLRFRLDAGDGSAVVDYQGARFTHRYESSGTFTARLLLIDDADRLHEEQYLAKVQ